MKNIFNKEYSILIFLVCLYLLLQLPFLTKITKVWVDEPWYSSTSYNFTIGEGLQEKAAGSGAGEYLFVYTLLMGVFFKIFGTSLFAARLFSVIGGLLGMYGFIYILKEFKIKKIFILFTSLLYIFSNVNYIIFRTVRPEGWVVTFVIWGFYFLIKAIKYNKGLDYFFSGLLISGSFLCHPNTALYVFLFGVLSLALSIKKRKLTFFANYLLGCFVILAILFFYIIFFKRQNLISLFDSWLGRTSVISTNIFVAAWNYLIYFVKIYTLGIKRSFIFIFEIGVLMLGLFYYKKDKYIFFLSLLGLSYFVLAIVFLKPFSTRHFGEILIFSFISFSLILQHFKVKRQKLFILIGAFYLLNNIAGNLYVIKRDYKKTPYSYIEKRIDEIVPDNTKVVTLLNFWFPLKNNDNYNSYTRWDRKNYKNLDELLKSGDLDYVVISDYLTKSGTATSGRKEDNSSYNRYKIYYQKVHNFANENGKLIDTVKTNNYGDIEIFKVKKNVIRGIYAPTHSKSQNRQNGNIGSSLSFITKGIYFS